MVDFASDMIFLQQKVYGMDPPSRDSKRRQSSDDHDGDNHSSMDSGGSLPAKRLKTFTGSGSTTDSDPDPISAVLIDGQNRGLPAHTLSIDKLQMYKALLAELERRTVLGSALRGKARAELADLQQDILACIAFLFVQSDAWLEDWVARYGSIPGTVKVFVGSVAKLARSVLNDCMFGSFASWHIIPANLCVRARKAGPKHREQRSGTNKRDSNRSGNCDTPSPVSNVC